MRVLNRQRRRCFTLMLVACALPFPGEAHLPEYFGRRYVLVDDSPRPPPEDPCRGKRASLRRDTEALRKRLEDRQREEGAYSVVTADPLGELGGLYASQCNHPAALKAHRQTIQLLRINEGLLTPSQIPYLKSMADSSQAIGDFESAQLTLRYVFRIHGMGLGDLSRVAIDDALAYFRRAREIFIDPTSPADIDLFVQAYEDNRAMYEAQVEDAGSTPRISYPDRRAIALSHLYNLYMLLGTDLDRYGGGADAGGARWDFLQRMQLLAYSQGVDIVDGLIEDPDAQDPGEQARLLLQRGNWQQWNGKWQSACDSLEEAWGAASGEAGAKVREQLSQPAELPEDPALWDYLLGPDIAVLAEVSAGFRVSARGVVSRVEGGVVDDANPALGGRVLRWLRDSHMRPAVRDGACVAAELPARRYRLLD